jgi:hypothetical protein
MNSQFRHTHLRVLSGEACVVSMSLGMTLIRMKFVVVFILLAGSIFAVMSQRKAHVSTRFVCL